MYYCCQAGSVLVGEDDALGSGGAVAARIDSSYMINMRDLDMRHVKDFTFVHGECNSIICYHLVTYVFVDGNDKNTSFQDMQVALMLINSLIRIFYEEKGNFFSGVWGEKTGPKPKGKNGSKKEPSLAKISPPYHQ